MVGILFHSQGVFRQEKIIRAVLNAMQLRRGISVLLTLHLKSFMLFCTMFRYTFFFFLFSTCDSCSRWDRGGWLQPHGQTKREGHRKIQIQRPGEPVGVGGRGRWENDPPPLLGGGWQPQHGVNEVQHPPPAPEGAEMGETKWMSSSCSVIRSNQRFGLQRCTLNCVLEAKRKTPKPLIAGFSVCEKRERVFRGI